MSKATVDHWIGVIRREGAFIGLRGEPHGTLKQRALALLITSDWLIGEAARQGVLVSVRMVDEGLANRQREITEFKKYLHETGQTLAGVKLEITAELAAEALRQKLAARAGRLTPREVVSFYHNNPRLFTTEERITELIEGMPSAAAATALVHRMGSGQRFAELAIHEGVTFDPAVMRTPEKAQLVNAIFTSRPGVVSRPLLVNRSWAVFVVRQVIPGRIKPLADARAAVLLRLRLRESRELALVREFDSYYTARWEARTSCRPEYIGPGCPQFAGRLGVYEDPFSTKERALLSEPLSPLSL
jgi:hypothetical protein